MTKLINTLTSLKRERKNFIVRSVDFFCILISIYLAFLASGISILQINFSQSVSLVSIPFVTIFIFNYLGVYRSVVRYIEFSSIYLLFRGFLFSCVVNIFIYYLFNFFIIDLVYESLIYRERKNR